jgi:type II secretory pathway component PulF
MPYYTWRGVDILGEYKKGKMYARSPEYLDAQLFKREIALLKFRPSSWRWRYRAVTQELKIELFKQMATLIDGGVALPQALLIVAEQLHHPGMQEIIHELADMVDHGNSFSIALCKYSPIFDPITIQLVKAGEESSSLAEAMMQVADRLEMREEFTRAVRAAVVLPALTFGFFVTITLFLFTFIVPRFAELFASMNQKLPASTQFMLCISNFLCSWHAVVAGGLVGLMGYAVYAMGRTKRGKELRDRVVLHIPILNVILWYRFTAYFLASVALLLERGLQLVPALRTVAQSMDNLVLREYVQGIADKVNNGRSLSIALQDVAPAQFPLELIALVHVGENSGTLEILLKKASIRYQNQVKRLLTRLTAFVQPILMIVLGLLVLLLIFAIYLPILELSNAV